ncbi:cell wall-active antibiotics response protein LiaF [Niallia sp. NCCP-28]|uniref:cell wall-active antibiotics response protein LiaF n=1 Tax=Niallia sp. NCCP-28 TaxID=2934712 RepID=UPI00208B45E4|nr:cell wall-active antibiotics response protein LiaF [Niallia sp. NCCP-28]GKU84439.1 transporter [Niallia sp. NCCP-28]
MFQRLKDNYANWVILIGGIILLLEVFVFNPGIIFSFFIAIGMIYFSRQGQKGKMGKLLFWIGLFILFISIFNMFTFKFLVISIVIYYIIIYLKKNKASESIMPIVKEKKQSTDTSEIVIKKPFFQNQLFQRNETPDHVYEWNDINIQAGISDTVIDLSYTVLPAGETVIFIKNMVGNVKIYVPYDIEASVHHSVLFGSYNIFGEQESHVINRNIQIRPSTFDSAETRVKIFTSFATGNLEVKRI